MYASPYDAAAGLARAGRFAEALTRLQEGGARLDNQPAQVLLAELLEHTGRYDEAIEIAERVLRARQLAGALASRCQVVLGHIAMTAGRQQEALERYRQAVALAADDLEALCWAQIRLVYEERTRIDTPEVRALLADLRANATRLGDPFVTAALHIFVGGIEAERTALDVGGRHLAIADRILAAHSNEWLEAESEIAWTAIDYLRDDVEAAGADGERALRLAQTSGERLKRAMALGNLGQVRLAQGRYLEAQTNMEASVALCPHGSRISVGLMDGLARSYLAVSRFDECDAVLRKMDEMVEIAGHRRAYEYRWSRPTVIRAAIKRGQMSRAIALAEDALLLCRQSADQSLEVLLLTLIAEAASGFDADKCDRSLIKAISIPIRSLETVASREQAVGAAFSRLGLRRSASGHLERCARLCAATGRVPYDSLAGPSPEAADPFQPSDLAIKVAQPPIPVEDSETLSALESVIGGLSSLSTLSRSAEAFGLEVLSLLRVTDSARWAVLLCRDADDFVESFGSLGTYHDGTEVDKGESDPVRLMLGTTHRGRFELAAVPNASVLAASIFTSIWTLASAAVAWRQHADKLSAAAALWPLDDGEELTDATGGVFVGAKSRQVVALARRAATTDVRVLITGESGTGKELVARLIHQQSARAGRPFVPFNCAAVPHDMLDGQLFGHRRGAFTGATESFQGVIRGAAGGTLLLDEIGEVPLGLQPKLLRFLESGEVHPIGEARPVAVNVRILAATNADLEKLVAEGRFREDLYYRLNVVHVRMPTLDERREEIPLLARHFLRRYMEELAKPDIQLSGEALEHLLLRPWPGNIRELANALQRAVALSLPGTTLMPEHFGDGEPRPAAAPAPSFHADETVVIRLDQTMASALDQLERAMVRHAVEQAGGHVQAAADALGLSRKGLYLKRQRLGMVR
jgi:DNA-binding NtrC family response regulator/tetratricopeptide (TPR) repeat protein